MKKIIVAGIGTDVGKTIVSAILVQALRADYWKPIQCGNKDEPDRLVVKKLIGDSDSVLHQEAYFLEHPLSPHHAARLENVHLCHEKFVLPATDNSLVIECAGGVMVPLTNQSLLMETFSRWDCEWILVSRHYVGSINHTLLTIEYLKHQRVQIKGLIFNGLPNPDSESFILNYSNQPCLGRLYPEQQITQNVIKRYADLWKPQL